MLLWTLSKSAKESGGPCELPEGKRPIGPPPPIYGLYIPFAHLLTYSSTHLLTYLPTLLLTYSPNHLIT
jgi:hypothetical protein